MGGPAPPGQPRPSSSRPPPHLQTLLCLQASKGTRQEGCTGPGPEKAQAGTKVWRRRSAHVGSEHGQKSSAWVSAGDPWEKKRRRARRHRARGQSPDAVRPRHCATYSVRSCWHRASAVHASAATTHRFRASELGDPDGGAGRLRFSVQPTGTLQPRLRSPKVGARSKPKESRGVWPEGNEGLALTSLLSRG